MDTPSLVIVGAPHFFSRTTLRPFGPRVTLTASASWFIPRSSPRRASSLNAIILAIGSSPPLCRNGTWQAGQMPATDGLSPVASMYATRDEDLIVPTQSLLGCHSHWESANELFSTLPGRVQARDILSRECILHR